MKQILRLVMFTCLALGVCTGNVLATNYDYGDAPGYAQASNATPDWQRLGINWDAEPSQKLQDTSDDGVFWSVNGGAFGHDAITVGDDVEFKFVMYKREWGRHEFDFLKVWVDWNQNGTFDDGVLYQDKWAFKTDPGDLGQTPTTNYAYGDGLAQIYKTFSFTINDIAVNPGDYWLRARVVCNPDAGSLDSFAPTKNYWQGETEDWEFTVKSVPEPGTMLLLGLGLIGLAGTKKKMQV